MSSFTNLSSSLSSVVSEQQRELRTGDDKFLKPFLYFFELRIPSSASANTYGITTFFFPLVLNPESIQLGEPFSVDVAMTQGSGLFVEESGIIQRTLMIRGQTGWKPKPMNGDTLQLLALKDKKSYSRSLPQTLDSISGMRHFQYLQDAVFRTYGDLKRDPATSDGTILIWHDPKHEEHWKVVPRNFMLEQSKDRPVSYMYTIDLLIVDKAESVDALASEDKNLLAEIKSGLATAQKFIDTATGALQDLTALASTITGLVKDIGVIIDNVSNFVTAAKNFIAGVTSLIESPLALVNSTAELVENGLSFYTDLQASGKAIVAIPDAILQSMRQLTDSLHYLGMHPESFSTSAQTALEQIRASQAGGVTTVTQTSTPVVAPTTFQQVNNLGTGPLPGDASRAAAATTLGSSVKAFTGAQQYNVQQGDTLVNLAAKFLGDARQWQYIAAANGLKPPFVNAQASSPFGVNSEQSLPGAIGVGASILIPNYSKPPEAQPLLPVLGVPPDATADIHLLGTDLMLGPVGGTSAGGAAANPGAADQLDLVIDVEQGSIDFKTVSGVANLTQGLTTRVTTDRGSDTLYQTIGLQRIVSTNIATVDLETARFRVQETLSLDPRVAAVQQVVFTVVQDAVYVDATVQVRGFAQPSNVQVAV